MQLFQLRTDSRALPLAALRPQVLTVFIPQTYKQSNALHLGADESFRWGFNEAVRPSQSWTIPLKSDTELPDFGLTCAQVWTTHFHFHLCFLSRRVRDTEVTFRQRPVTFIQRILTFEWRTLNLAQGRESASVSLWGLIMFILLLWFMITQWWSRQQDVCGGEDVKRLMEMN